MVRNQDHTTSDLIRPQLVDNFVGLVQRLRAEHPTHGIVSKKIQSRLSSAARSVKAWNN